MGLTMIVLFMVEWSYHTLFEWLWQGSTPGKRALGIRVVRSDGVAIDFVRSAMRNLLRAADIFPFAYGAGLAVMFCRGIPRRLGDLAADTMVVREERPRLDALPPLPSRARSLAPATLGGAPLSRRDYASIDEFFRRRHLFSEERANELAAILAEPLIEHLELSKRNPIDFLAAVLLASRGRRSSWFGTDSRGQSR